MVPADTPDEHVGSGEGLGGSAAQLTRIGTSGQFFL